MRSLLLPLIAFSIALSSISSPDATAAGSPQAILNLPSNVDFALAVTDAQDIVDSPLASMLTALSGDNNLQESTTLIATALASKLGLQTDDFVRNLLTEQLVICSAPIADGNRQWAVIIEASDSFTRAVRANLLKQPRATVRGIPTFDINGSYKVAAIPTPPSAGSSQTFIVTRTADTALFEQIINSAVAPDSTSQIQDTQRAKSLKALTPDQFVFVSSITALNDLKLLQPAPQAKMVEPADSFSVIIGAQLKGNLFTSAFIADASLLLDPKAAAEPVTPWPITTFQAISSDATLAVVEHGSFGLGLSDRVLRALAERSQNNPPNAKAIDPNQGLNQVLSVSNARRAFALYPPVQGSNSPEVFVAIEVSDVVDAARIGDKPLIERFVPQSDHHDIEPAAIRSVDLAPLLGPFTTVAYGNTSPEVRWTYRRAPRAEAMKPLQSPGWWSLGIGADNNRFFDATSILTGEREDVQALPWLALGSAQPAKLLADDGESATIPLIALTEGRTKAILNALASTSAMNWRLLRSTNGLLIGGIALRFETPPDAPQDAPNVR